MQLTIKEFKAIAKDIIKTRELENEIIFIPSDLSEAVACQDYEKVTMLSMRLTTVSKRLVAVQGKYIGNECYTALLDEINKYNYSNNITPQYLYERHNNLFFIIDGNQ